MVEDGNGKILNGRTGCHALGVPATTLYTKMRRCNALLTFLRAPNPLCASELSLTLNLSDHDHNDEDDTSAACGHVIEWQGARLVIMANPP